MTLWLGKVCLFFLIRFAEEGEGFDDEGCRCFIKDKVLYDSRRVRTGALSYSVKVQLVELVEQRLAIDLL